MTITGPVEALAESIQQVDFVVEANRSQLTEIVQRFREGRLKTNTGSIVSLDDAIATYNSPDRIKGKTIVRVRQ